MEELRELFGDGALTAEEFDAKCAEKGYKLADISKGAYVAKEKFDRQKAEFDKYKAENDISKYADYDDIVKERNLLKAEKEEAALVSEVAAAGVAEPFRKFVLSEVRGNVTEQKPFKTALEEYLKDNEQYKQAAQPQPIIRFGSQLATDKGEGAKTGANSYMNEKIRAAANK